MRKVCQLVQEFAGDHSVKYQVPPPPVDLSRLSARQIRQRFDRVFRARLSGIPWPRVRRAMTQGNYAYLWSPVPLKQSTGWPHCETAWIMDLSKSGVQWGIEHGSHLHLGFSLRFMSPSQIARLPEVVRAFFAAAVATGCSNHGLADCADVREIMVGRHYGTAGQGSILFQRQVNQLIWIKSGGARSYGVRGVFWGNLFSPSIVKALDGAESFIDRYSRLGPDAHPELCTVYPDGSMLVFLCKSVEQFQWPNIKLMPTTIDRAAWLYEQLASRGLVCGTHQPVHDGWAEHELSRFRNESASRFREARPRKKVVNHDNNAPSR